MSHGQGVADIGAYNLELQQTSARADGRAEATRRVLEVAATGSMMKTLDSIQVSFVVPGCQMQIASVHCCVLKLLTGCPLTGPHRQSTGVRPTKHESMPHAALPSHSFTRPS